MTTLKFGTMLFGSTRATKICPEVKVGTAVTTSTLISSKHTGGKGAPKISKIAIALDKILLDKSVSALYGDDGKIYCEVNGSSGKTSLWFNGITLTSSDPNADKYSNIVPLLLYALCPASRCDETILACNKLVDSFIANGDTVGKDELAYLCDCHYFDLKNAINEISLISMDSSTLLQIEQAARTGNLKPFDTCKLKNYIGTSFSSIAYALPSTAPTTSKSSTKDSDFISRCKAGDFEVGYEWSDEQMKRIRPLTFLDKFVPNKAFKMMTTLANYDLSEVGNRIADGKNGVEAIGDNYLNLILVGKPGTGKTTTAEALSATLGLPIYTVSLSKNTEEDEMQGKTKVVSGGFEFKSTPFLDAYEHGGIVVLEEFNLADPGMMQGAIGQAIEYPFVLMKDGYEEVHRHPMCVFISTMNTATQGAREPNEALTSRSPITIMMEDPDDNEFIEILKSKGYGESACKKVYKAYKNILNYLVKDSGDEELAMCVTLRHCIGALKLIKAGFDFNDAIHSTMIGSIAIKNLELANEIYTSVIASKRY